MSKSVMDRQDLMGRTSRREELLNGIPKSLTDRSRILVHSIKER